MTREEIEALCAEVGTMLQASIKSDPATDGKVGFCLLMFDFGDRPDGSFAYAANAVRADVVKLLAEASEKIGADGPNVRPIKRPEPTE